MSSLEPSEIEKMIEVASEVVKNAFVLESSTKYGACILSDSGEYISGCNVQNVISGIGVCSERGALYKAISEGIYKFRAIVIYSSEEGIDWPCGVCLQELKIFSQIAGHDIGVIAADSSGYEVSTLKELLPRGYETSSCLDELTEYKEASK